MKMKTKMALSRSLINTHFPPLSGSSKQEIPGVSLFKHFSCSFNLQQKKMALKAVHSFHVPKLDHVTENAAFVQYSSRFSKGTADDRGVRLTAPKFLVIGHRGSGMNMLQSSDQKMKAIKENSILSFNAASQYAVDFIEFDVQVTKDDCPVIFHDNTILTEEKGAIVERRVTDLTLSEFLSYGPQRDPSQVGKPLLRKIKDGRIFNWIVEKDDSFCTLQEAFQKVDPSLGFNIELKFDDKIIYKEAELKHALQVVLQAVFENAKDRPIIFSSFQPDAAQLIRKLQSTYPVFFLTDGGSEIHLDTRRNSLEEAITVCLEGGLQGIVSEVKAIFRNPRAITRIKECKLTLITYGQLNNVPEAVYMQHLMGVEGVIVDLVQDITAAVSQFGIESTEDVQDITEAVSPFGIESTKGGEVEHNSTRDEGQMHPKFSQNEISFLLKLIPELIQH